jgi:hypothetical protein
VRLKVAPEMVSRLLAAQESRDLAWTKLSTPGAARVHSSYAGPLLVLFPYVMAKLESWVGLNLVDSEEADFFRAYVSELYHERKSSGDAKKDDIFQMLVELVDEGNDGLAGGTGGAASGERKRVSLMELAVFSFSLLSTG